MNSVRTLHSAGHLLAIVVLLAWPVSQLLAEATASVQRLRAAYEAYSAEIESNYNKRLTKWESDYKREIGAIAVAAQRAGEFENWQAATKEAERFVASPTIPEQTPITASPAIRNLQQRYRTTAREFREQREKQSADLTDKYSQRLLALQTEATRAGKFQEALIYNEEVKRLEPILAATRVGKTPDEEVANADTAPAAGGDAGGQLAGAEPDSSQTPGSGADASKAAAELKLPEGVKISEGNIAPTIAGMSFRPLSLTPTQRMRVSRRLSVQAEQSSKSSSASGMYGMRSEKDQRVVRIRLRPATTSIELEGALLVVQLYGKDARASISRITPSLEGQQKVPLPKISPNIWLFVQLPEAVFERSSYTRRVQTGVDFYGIIVSVFDSDGELAYQATSVPGLMDLVPQTIPEDPPEPELLPGMPAGPF